MDRFAQVFKLSVGLPFRWLRHHLPQLRGSIDTSNAVVDLTASVFVPIFGYTNIASIQGSLASGSYNIMATFDLIIASGFINVYLKNKKSVWVNAQVSTLGVTIDKDILLFDLSYVVRVALSL